MRRGADTPPRDFAAGWYVAAFVLYVALGLALKAVVLNWIVGPLFLLATLHVLPGAMRRLWAGGRRTSQRV